MSREARCLFGEGIWLPASIAESGLSRSVYVWGSGGDAWARVQISAAIEEECIGRAPAAFAKVGDKVGLL